MNHTPEELERLLAVDREHVWHPYAPMPATTPAHPVVSAAGVRLTLADGRELIDGMSSWWAAIHGYNHPVLNNALTDQVGRMAHVMFGGLTHPPAIRLAELLLEVTPPSLTKVFFADSGSVAVEVAIKMALQYWRSQGRPERHRMFTIRGGYHGDTFGDMAVCDPVNGMHHLFTDVLPRHVFAPSPPLWREDRWEGIAQGDTATDAAAVAQADRLAQADRSAEAHRAAEADRAYVAQLRDLVAAHAHELAAIIIEPVVQGAGGMRFYNPDHVAELRALADEHDLLLIADEIATGFCRTGSWWACEQAGVVPDIMCVGKALTGGYLTMAATLCTDRVAHGISGGPAATQGAGVLMHGPTYMANPLAAAVACASIELLLKGRWCDDVMSISRGLREGLEPARGLPGVTDVRVLGAIGVIETAEPVDVSAVQKVVMDHGVWLRPFRNLIYTMPPYISSADEIAQITAAMLAAVRPAQRSQVPAVATRENGRVASQ